jgi:uncharacterized protein
LNETFSGTNDLIFLIEALSEDRMIADPESLHAIDVFQEELGHLNGVGKVISVVDTLKRINRTLKPESATSQLPSSRELAVQYLFLYTLSGGDDLSTRITADYRLAKIIVMLKDDSTQFGEDIIRRANEIASRVLPSGYRMTVAGTLASNAALTETIVSGKVVSVIQVIGITLFVSVLVFRSWLAGIFVAAPLALTVLINLGVMSMAGLTLDVSTAVITAMAVGIGADYSVYFLFRLREEYQKDGDYPASLRTTMTTSGAAVLFVSAAVAMGYGVLCFSGFSIFIQLGALVGLSMLTSSLSTLVFVPAFVTLAWQAGLVTHVLRPRTATTDHSGAARPRAAR